MFLCLDVNGKKRIAASASAALELRARDLPDPALIRERFRTPGTKPGAFLFEGFLLENKPVKKRCLEIAGSFVSSRSSVSSNFSNSSNSFGYPGFVPAFDPGTADLAETYAEEILSWPEQYRLVLFVNEAEAEALARRAFGGTPRAGDWKALFGRLGEKGGTVAVKLAEKGAAVFSGGGFYRVETRPVKTAETTGAGDAFAAGFLAALLRGLDPEQCGREGNLSARRFLERETR
ncbi:MAG: PfkB family carbohydrate kinase [Treponema sp.]|nr:PfkB family carbohydrate kinase [Treponema sp.]